jgi:hypothetical protein
MLGQAGGRQNGKREGWTMQGERVAKGIEQIQLQ